MSRHISCWREGCSAEWRGPFGGFTYSPNKVCLLTDTHTHTHTLLLRAIDYPTTHHTLQYTHIGMLACGTGIAPMIQVIRAVVENEDDQTFLHLIYASRTPDDILMKEQLDHFASFWNFTVLYSLSRTSQSSLSSRAGSIKYADKVHIGRIGRKVVEQEMPHPSNSGRKVKVLICGTPSFNEDMTIYLTQIGYTSDMCFTF